MALKPDREELAQDISWYMDEAAERGGIATMLTAGSGGGWKTVMGDTLNTVTYAASPTNKKPIGILMNDMVAVEDVSGLTRNWDFKDEMAVGMKCCLLRRGWVVTDKISGTPVGGETAYVGASGLITPTSGGAVIGQFLGSKDEDGYARVSVLL
jgi:hypothetical protein